MRLLLNGRGVEVLGKRLKEENHYVATAPNLNSKIGAANAKVVHKPDVVVGELGQGDVAVAFDGLGVKVWGMCSWGDMAYKSEEYWEQLLEVVHSHTIPLLDLQGEVNEAHVEINCGAVWRGDRFYYHHVVLVEHGFMDGGVGVDTVSGCLLFPVNPSSPIMEFSISRLEPLMRKGLYVGPVWVGVKPIVGFELMRCAALLEVLKGEVGEALFGKVVDLRFEKAIALHLSVPPFPNAPLRLGERVSKVEVSAAAFKHTYLYDAPVGGDLGYVTARGVDIREAKRRVYRTIRGVSSKTPLQYRLDIGEASGHVWQQLRSLRVIY